MKLNKNRIIMVFLVLIILLFIILISCNWKKIHLMTSTKSYNKLIEQGNLEDLSLTIYYMNPFTLTPLPISVENLINIYHDHKVVINGSRLVEHIDLLKQMSNEVLIPVEQESYLDARLYFVFETKKNRKILDVSMWGVNYSFFVNGIEIKENDIFYKVVMPFLPKNAVKELETYIDKRQASSR